MPSAALTLLGWEVPAQPGPEASRAQCAQAAHTMVSRLGGDGAAPGSSTLVGAGCTWTRRKRVPKGCEAQETQGLVTLATGHQGQRQSRGSCRAGAGKEETASGPGPRDGPPAATARLPGAGQSTGAAGPPPPRGRPSDSLGTPSSRSRAVNRVSHPWALGNVPAALKTHLSSSLRTALRGRVPGWGPLPATDLCLPRAVTAGPTGTGCVARRPWDQRAQGWAFRPWQLLARRFAALCGRPGGGGSGHGRTWAATSPGSTALTREAERPPGSDSSVTALSQ